MSTSILATQVDSAIPQQQTQDVLCDGNGNDVSSSGVVVTAVSLMQVSMNTTNTIEDAGNSNPDSNFRFDPELGSAGGYVFNLKTTGL